jgi:hypothetical protein
LRCLTVVAQTLCLLVVFGVSGTLSAADSTSFNPSSITVIAQASSVPVGTIVIWQSPADPGENWLDCNGQAVSATVYPELYAIIVGGTVPDYRGLFLRGVGGQSEAIGVTQPDTAYFSEGTTVKFGGSMKMVSGWGGHNGEYVFSTGAVWGNDETGGSGVYSYTGSKTQDIAVEITNGATETRPVNKAVRYLIRAKP